MSRESDQPDGSDTICHPSLPTGWCWSTVAHVITDCQYGSSAKTSEVPEGVPVLRMGNIQDGRVDPADLKYLPANHPEFPKLLLQHGDLLFNRTNSAELVGKSAVYTGDPSPCSYASYLVLLRLGPACVSKYLCSYLNSHFGRLWVRSVVSQQVGQANVNSTKLRALQFPLAPLNEQRRIVAKIEELFSELDAGVAALQRVRANLKRYRASVLHAAVTGKLTEAWRAKHRDVEPASELVRRILAERRRKWEQEQLAKFTAASKTPPKDWQSKYVEPTAPDTTGLPKLPSGWCWASVEQVAEFTRYGSSSKTNEESSGVPVLRMGNIVDGSLDLGVLKYLPQNHSEFPELLLQKGDLLFNRTNSAELVGKSAVYEGQFTSCSYASYLIGVRCLSGCDSRFLCHYINSSYGRQWVKSVVSQQVGQANVNGSKLQALAFPLPPSIEQEQILLDVAEKFSQIEAVTTAIERDLLRAARLRQSILKRAFEGKLVPQDPSDEPADKLLARIRQQRAEANGSETRKKAPAKRRGKQTEEVAE